MSDMTLGCLHQKEKHTVIRLKFYNHYTCPFRMYFVKCTTFFRMSSSDKAMQEGDAATKFELVLIYLNFYLSFAAQVLNEVDKKELILSNLNATCQL